MHSRPRKNWRLAFGDAGDVREIFAFWPRASLSRGVFVLGLAYAGDDTSVFILDDSAVMAGLVPAIHAEPPLI